jgi:hypothetical protein
MVRAAIAAFLAAGVVTAVPASAYAVSATGTDPTGDISIGGTYDITQLGVDLMTSTVTVTVKTAAALPPLSDPSWANANNNAGRRLAVVLGDDLGNPGFYLDGDNLYVSKTTGPYDAVPCSGATRTVVGDTVTMSAPAWCFRYPGKIQAMAVMQRGISPAAGEVDIAIAPQLGDQPDGPDITTVDASIPGGYYQFGADGGVFAFGAPFYGSTGNFKLNKPVVGMSAQPGNIGYRFVASDGGVFSYGSAGFCGSMGGQPLNKPVVGMATTPSGNGYWLVASDGGIFAYGDAGFYGSTGSLRLNKPIVGMAATPSGNGYWLVASDGGVFAYGDAGFHGSTGSMALNQPVVGLASSHSGNGYLLVAKDGGVFAYGDAHYDGSGTNYFQNDVVGISTDGTDNGYYIASASGEVVNFGSLYYFGDVRHRGLEMNAPIAGMALGH